MSVLYIIDSQVPDFQVLRASLPEDAEVIVLDVFDDGVEQIVRALDGRTGVDALHIISHGSSGMLRLGSTLVDAAYLAQNPQPWDRIGRSLTETGDILLYGCNVAAGEGGRAFVDQLARVTGADVAASDDAPAVRLWAGTGCWSNLSAVSMSSR